MAIKTKLPGKAPGIDKRRLMFINGQIAKGNLKSKRKVTKGELMQRLIDRLIVNELADKQPDCEKQP